MKIAAINQAVAGLAAGNGTWGGQIAANQAQLTANYAQAEAQKEAQKEAEKKAKGKGLGKIAGLVLGTVGNAIAPGIGGAAGWMVGEAGGQLAGGGSVDPASVLTAGVTNYMGGKMMPAGDTAAQGATGAGDAAAQGVAQSTAASNDAVKNFREVVYAGNSQTPPPVPRAEANQLSAMTPEARGAYFGRAPVYPAQQQTPGFTDRLGAAFAGYGQASALMNGMGSLSGMMGGGAAEPQARMVRDPQTGRLIMTRI